LQGLARFGSSVQVRSGQVWSGLVRSSQFWSGQVWSGQVKFKFWAAYFIKPLVTILQIQFLIPTLFHI
jgi:hypothetical protein